MDFEVQIATITYLADNNRQAERILKRHAKEPTWWASIARRHIGFMDVRGQDLVNLYELCNKDLPTVELVIVRCLENSTLGETRTARLKAQLTRRRNGLPFTVGPESFLESQRVPVVMYPNDVCA